MYFIKNVQISKGTASAKNDTHLPHHSLTLKKWFYLLNKHETFVFIFLRCRFCFFLSALKQNRESGIDFCRAKTGFQNESCVRIQHVRSPPSDNGKWNGWRSRSRVFDIPQIKTASDEVCHWKNVGRRQFWCDEVEVDYKVSSTQIFGALQTRTQSCSYLELIPAFR